METSEGPYSQKIYRQPSEVETLENPYRQKVYRQPSEVEVSEGPSRKRKRGDSFTKSSVKRANVIRVVAVVHNPGRETGTGNKSNPLTDSPASDLVTLERKCKDRLKNQIGNS